MEFLRDVYKRRRKYFDNLEYYLEEIKKIVKRKFPDAEIYLYGSVVDGDYSIGLSDVDIGIVSDELSNRDKKLELFGELTKKFFESPFEFHIFTKEQWKSCRRFIGKFRKI